MDAYWRSIFLSSTTRVQRLISPSIRSRISSGVEPSGTPPQFGKPLAHVRHLYDGPDFTVQAVDDRARRGGSDSDAEP